MINKNIHVEYIYILEWINNLCNKVSNIQTEYIYIKLF